MLRRLLTAALLALCLGLAACGGNDEEEATAQATPTETPAAEATPEPTPEPSGDPADVEAIAAEITEDLDEKPEIPAPEGEPPAELVTEDIVKGKGKTAEAGSTIQVQYVGVSWSTGEEFDASWDRGEPFEFPLGGGQVIQGWDQGFEGMKEGGRRLLVIPPEMGYGPQGSPPAIGPNETLLFVVDLVKAD